MEGESIANAFVRDAWVRVDDTYKLRETVTEHMGISQRWLVVYSEQARERARKTLQRQEQKARGKLKKAIFHLQADRFDCEADARKALVAIEKTSQYHTLEEVVCTGHKHYTGRGRPKKDAEASILKWQVEATIQVDEEAMSSRLNQKSCFVLATNAAAEELDAEQILARYKAQSSVETGFRFLKDPLFFVSSLFIKKTSRIDALIMVMTLSLLIYSIAQRRLRATMAKTEASIPNQIDQPTPTPTLRWIFQCFEGINLVQFDTKYTYEKLHVDGLTQLRARIIAYLGGRAVRLYNIKKTGPHD